MRKTFSLIIVAGSLAALLAGCNGYNKLLKSNNPDLMFRKAIEYYEAEKFTKTIQLLEEVARRYSGTNRADSVAFYMAASYYRNGEWETSSMMFDDFRQFYKNSVFLEEAEYMYAKGYYLLSPAANRDQSNTMKALVAIDEYVERYPQSTKRDAMQDNVKELQGKLEDKAYLNAKSYYITEKYKAAIVALKNTLARYPDSKYREEMLYLTAKSGYLLAHNSIKDLQRDRYLDMMDSYYNFVAEYPESKYTPELDKMQEEAKRYSERFQDLNNKENTSENGD